MTKKIILTIFVIVALISCSVYATEAPSLTPSVNADNLQNTPVVGTETPKESLTPADMARTTSGSDTERPDLTPTLTAEDLQNTSVVNTDTTGTNIDYAEPVIGNDQEDGIMPINDNVETPFETSEVKGDTFVSEDIIEISGKEFDGNVLLGGQQTSFSNSYVYGDLFIFSQSANLQMIYVVGNIYIASESISLNSVNVSGNMFLASNSLTMSGSVAQDLFIAANSITMDNDTYILRNVYAAANSIKLGSVVIGRDANIQGKEIDVSENATITGNLNKDIITEDMKEETSSISYSVYSVVKSAISALAICGFIFLFGKGFFEKQKADNVAGYLLKGLGKGVLFALLIPVVAFLLLCTGLAVGLSVIVMFIYIIIFAISTSIVSIAITANVTKNMQYNAWRFYGISILVAIVLAILKQLPVIGGVIAVIVALTGMGLIFSSLKTKKENKEEVVTTTAE